MLHFAWPWFALLLPLPWLIRRFVPAASQTQSGALRVPFFQNIQQLQQQTSSGAVSRTKLIVMSIVWSLLVVAVMRPQWLGDPVPLPRQGRNIILAVDISGSMQIPDMTLKGKQATRLDVVKAVASKFIQRRKGDRLGLILFGTRAYLQTPLTFDRKTVQALLNDTTIGLAGRRTAVGDATGLAIKRLREQDVKNRILILLTDGASNAGILQPKQAAELAAKNDVRIYTIGIGNDRYAVKTVFGPQLLTLNSDLDVKTLQQMAQTTQGLFFRAKDTKSLEKVYAKIDAVEPIQVDKSVFRPVQALYPWPLAFALGLFFLLLLPKVYRVRIA